MTSQQGGSKGNATKVRIEDWIARDAIPFSLDSEAPLMAAIDRLLAGLTPTIELLALGEALHGGESILQLRNRLFRRLVQAHGYSAIAIESNFPRSRLVDEYVAGQGAATFDEIVEAGFGHGFGRLEANRELIEWMRDHNADPAHRTKVRFYGFDMPVLQGLMGGPRSTLEVPLDYLASIDGAPAQARREKVQELLGRDSDWENPAAIMDRTKSVGQSASASALRLETEDLIGELRLRRPELVARSRVERFEEALQHARVARHLLNYHAAAAGAADASTLLGIRDVTQLDNLLYILGRERGRGKVFAFAHSSHLQRSKAVWPWYSFWPAGAHLDGVLGERYAVIGSGLVASAENGIAASEPGTLEARSSSAAGPSLFILTHRGQGFRPEELAALQPRSGSTKNLSYAPLNAQSLQDFDALVILDESRYARGAPPLPEPEVLDRTR